MAICRSMRSRSREVWWIEGLTHLRGRTAIGLHRSPPCTKYLIGTVASREEQGPIGFALETVISALGPNMHHLPAHLGRGLTTTAQKVKPLHSTGIRERALFESVVRILRIACF